MQRLKGKVILVAGAGRIGGALASRYAAIKSRIGRPVDIAAMGALLMSDEGSYITGQVISIDGGTIMRA